MASFEKVNVQAAREWLHTQWVASERLVLYSVIEGVAREWLHMEQVVREWLGSYPTSNRAATEGLVLKKVMCKQLRSGYTQEERLGTGNMHHMYTWERLASSYVEIASD